MNRYEIRCTEQQTRKALELGAPIEIETSFMALVNRTYFDNENKYVIIPTAEQMIGWLEETLKEIRIAQSVIGSFYYEIYINPCEMVQKNCGYIYRKEATLAAIDAALDYLAKAKEESL